MVSRGSNKAIPYYMIDIIYKTVKPSQLKKLQIIKNIKNLMFQVIFCQLGETDFRKNEAWGNE